MASDHIESYKGLFSSRLDTLSHILEISADHFSTQAETIIDFRIADDMHPFGTQIVFSCNQARNFALWCQRADMDDLSTTVNSLEDARKIIAETQGLVAAVNADDSVLQQSRRINLSETQFLELPGGEYLGDFLLPNLYFHLTTAYNIMRLKGVALGKANYMLHLLPKVQFVTG